jgi:hypothetical protein
VRVIVCLIFSVLGACSTHSVRCDRHLQPINQIVGTAAVDGLPPRRSP